MVTRHFDNLPRLMLIATLSVLYYYFLSFLDKQFGFFLTLSVALITIVPVIVVYVIRRK